jgi:RNA polymerase sigma-70 factor (ECF subfamily)
MLRVSNTPDDSSDPQWFVTTHWSVVLSAGQVGSSQASAALEKLCRAYRQPIYGFIRRRGYRPEEAEDLTQDFFLKLLKKNFWSRADPQKGRFRSFLLKTLCHFLADEKDRVRTAKRGGGVTFIPFDEHTEDYFQAGLNQNLTDEQQFDLQWASSVLEQARSKLRHEYIAAGNAGLFNRVGLEGGKTESALPYAVIAKELGMSLGAIKSAISRLRQRYAQLVREEVAHTVSSPGELETELRHLLAIIGS